MLLDRWFLKSISALRASSSIAPAISTPVAEPPPTHDEIEGKRIAAVGIFFGFRPFQSQHDAPADMRRIVDRLRPGA